MKKTFLLLVLLLCLPSWGLSTVTKVVDPGNGGGTDYTTLDAYEDALGGTTTGHLPNDDQIALAQCRSSDNSDDTAAVEFNGWTTDSTRYIKVELHGDETNTGIFNGNNYVLAITDAGATGMLRVREDYVRIDGIQLQVTTTANNDNYGILVESQGASNDIWISNCILKGVADGTGSTRGIMVNDGDTIAKIWNCVVSGFFVSGQTGHRGIGVDACTSCEINNNTVYNSTRGMDLGNTAAVVRNCAVGNCDDDFVDADDVEYCCSDDEDGANSQAPSGGNWANEFETPGSDFRLKSGGNCVGNGTDDPGHPEQDHTDIAGTARTSTWDISAFELVTVAGFNMWFIRDNKKGGKL